MATRKRLREVEWEAIAGVLAAVVALALHIFHVVDTAVLLSVVLVLAALLLVRDLRREAADDRTAALLETVIGHTAQIRSQLSAPEVVLVGPRRLRAETELFARQSRGEMTWFNVCLDMFTPTEVFDAMLRPAIENPAVTAIQFLVDHNENEKWQRVIVPKLATCSGASKVREPTYVEMDENLSFILADTEGNATEALLSFWGEPFMARSTGREIPRFVFRIDGSSDLIARFIDIERSYRTRSRPVAS